MALAKGSLFLLSAFGQCHVPTALALGDVYTCRVHTRQVANLFGNSIALSFRKSITTMTTERPFIQRLQDHDPVAWRQVVSEFTPELYNYLGYTVPATTRVETLIVEIFQSLVAQIATVSQSLSLSTYLYSIAYYKVADSWRRFAPNDDMLWEDIDRVGLPSELSEPLAELPELAQQVIFLRYQVRLPVAALTEILGRSLKATDSLLSRSRQQFSAALAQNGRTLSDEELFALFQNKVPRLLLPPGCLERIQQQVLTYL